MKASKMKKTKKKEDDIKNEVDLWDVWRSC